MTQTNSEFLEQLSQDKQLVEYFIASVYREFLTFPFVAIDGGAHKGFHAFRLARLNSCRKVYAFEATPAQYNSFVNDLADLKDETLKTKVIPYEMALQSNPDIEFDLGKREFETLNRTFRDLLAVEAVPMGIQFEGSRWVPLI